MLAAFGNRVRLFQRSEHGASAIEYCFLCMLIALVIAVNVTAIGTTLNENYYQAAASGLS